jgi:hypothetical protein
MGFLEPVFDLLLSIHAILSHKHSEIVKMVIGIFKIWSQILADGSEKVYDLPLFDGPAIYDISPPNHLNVLDAVECEADFQKVWESLIFGAPVIVYGATPAIASRVVLELAWLVQPFSMPELFPYIPVSDLRFSEIVKRPRGIIGVSNPIAWALLAPGRTGVQVGFPRASFRLPFTGKVNSRERLVGIVRNTERLARAVLAALRSMAEKNPTGFAKGEVSLAVLMRSLVEMGVEMAMGAVDFATKLCGAPAFQDKFRSCGRQ